MFQRQVVQSLRKRLIAIGLGFAVLAAAVASYPVFTDGNSDEMHSFIYENATADPEWGDGDGGGG